MSLLDEFKKDPFDIDSIVILIKNGADIHCKDSSGFTALHYTSRGGHIKVVRLLLERGVNVNCKTNSEWTPLHLSCTNGYVETTKLLLDKGAEINVKNNEGCTPLHTACVRGHVSVVKLMVKLMLEGGADINIKNNDGRTPLMTVCQVGQVELLRLFLNSDAKFDLQGLLCLASRYGQVEVAQLLLDRGADVNFEVNDLTPLHSASRYGYVEIAKLLLDRGADINCKNSVGQTPLHFASYHEGTSVVKLLLDRGADVHCKNKNGKTPYDLTENKEIKTLLQQSPYTSKLKDLIDRNKIGTVQLFYASDDKVSNLKMVYDGKSISPLLYSIIVNSFDVASVLIDVYKNVQIDDDNNSVAMEYLLKIHPFDIQLLDLLITKCNCINHINKKGQTVLSMAIEMKSLILVKHLLQYPNIQLKTKDFDAMHFVLKLNERNLQLQLIQLLVEKEYQISRDTIAPLLQEEKPIVKHLLSMAQLSKEDVTALSKSITINHPYFEDLGDLLTKQSQVKPLDFNNQKRSVIVIGTTGSGKSTLINKLVGQKVCEENAGLVSVTKTIKPVSFKIEINDKLQEFDLYDTPGFGDNTGKTPVDIASMVAKAAQMANGVNAILIVIGSRADSNTLTDIDYLLSHVLMEQGYEKHVIFVRTRCNEEYNQVEWTKHDVEMMKKFKFGQIVQKSGGIVHVEMVYHPLESREIVFKELLKEQYSHKHPVRSVVEIAKAFHELNDAQMKLDGDGEIGLSKLKQQSIEKAQKIEYEKKREEGLRKREEELLKREELACETEKLLIQKERQQVQAEIQDSVNQQNKIEMLRLWVLFILPVA
eukprot:NODE_134_length_16603_cov_0.784052.p1 type:complete len:820 gc:universal NODE_134_length_16603_cov_0.784052:4696-2237(-)